MDARLPVQPPKTQRVKHQPAMYFRDIPTFLMKHDINCTYRNMTRSALLFTILTAARSGEVRGATWDEIDEENAIWTIPAKRMKMGEEHKVPLSLQALTILQNIKELRLGSKLIFPSQKGTPLSDMALTKFLRQIEAPSDSENRYATVHGFRSSFRDWCSEDGSISREIAEKALAHAVSNRVEAAYNRTKLLDLRIPVMQKWANYVCPLNRN